MAIYPGSENERRFDPAALAAAATEVFRAAGMPEANARTVGEALTDADIRGIHSHGLLRVEDYVKKLLSEGVDPQGAPSIVSKKGGAIRIDGGNALGQVSGVFAMDAAIEAARETAIAFAAVGGSNHCGAMDYFARRAAAAGMIGLAGTNALPTMAPAGGREKIVGLNPLSVAMPATGRPDFVLDAALGATAHGKIRVYAQKGAPVPEGWAFDKDGRPTTDATKALEGLIQPIGAHKGIGLAMMVGLMSTLLSGAGYGLESGNMIDGAYAGKDGHFFMAIDIAAFVEPSEFANRLGRILDDLEASERTDGVDAIYAPGALEGAFETAYGADGVPLNEETIASIKRAGQMAGTWLSLFDD